MDPITFISLLYKITMFSPQKNSNEDELLKFLELKEAQHQAAKLEGATRKRSDAVAVEIGSPLAIRNAFLFLGNP